MTSKTNFLLVLLSPLTFSAGLALQSWHCSLCWEHLWALALGCAQGKNRAFHLHDANVFLPRRSAIKWNVIIWTGDDRCVSLSFTIPYILIHCFAVNLLVKQSCLCSDTPSILTTTTSCFPFPTSLKVDPKNLWVSLYFLQWFPLKVPLLYSLMNLRILHPSSFYYYYYYFVEYGQCIA